MVVVPPGKTTRFGEPDAGIIWPISVENEWGHSRIVSPTASVLARVYTLAKCKPVDSFLHLCALVLYTLTECKPLVGLCALALWFSGETHPGTLLAWTSVGYASVATGERGLY